MTSYHNDTTAPLDTGITVRSRVKKTIGDSDPNGSVLLVIISTIAVLSALTAGVLNLKTTSTYTQLYANQQKRAYFLAESGGRHALPIVSADLTQAVATFLGLFD